MTDPELIELFDNWAFGEVLKDGTLDTKTRLMAQLAAIIVCQAVNEYRLMLGGALEVGVTPVEVKEIVYQAVPYVGMARDLPLPGQSTTNVDARFDKGLEVQRRIFGDKIDALYAKSPKDLSPSSRGTSLRTCLSATTARC